MGIYIGSARIGENGSIVGGKKGDQKQYSKNDFNGEVSSEPFYIHSQGWNILRPIKIEDADKLAQENKYACDNNNIGYNQNERYDVVTQAKKVKSLKDITTPSNSDCSSLTRAEIITAMGIDVGDFTTASCKDILVGSKRFKFVGKYISQEKTPIYNGDVLCTCTKGHVVTVNSGSPRLKYEPKLYTFTKKTALYKYENEKFVRVKFSELPNSVKLKCEKNSLNEANISVNSKVDVVKAYKKDNNYIALTKNGYYTYLEVNGITRVR